MILAEDKSALHAKLSPSERPYIGTGAGVGGLFFFYVVSQYASRVELYIDRPDVASCKRMFDELLSHKEEIENSFGEPLSWQRLDKRRACRIAYEMKSGGYKDDEANWQTTQIPMIDAMIRLENALSPFIANLTRTK